MVSIISATARADGCMSSIISKPQVPRPSLLRRRESEDAEEIVSSSPVKRAKVTFDNDVKVRVMDDWEKGPELIREEVRRAIERHAVGDDSIYYRVKDIYITKPFSEEAASSSTIKNYTSALLHNVSALNRSCSDLVHAVLNSEWLGRDETFVTLHVRFLGNLVSAQGLYLGDVLRMLVNNMTSAPPSNGKLPNDCAVNRSKIHTRAHSATKYLLQLIPSASSVLSSVITRTFPHSSDSQKAHIVYVRNLLRLVEYVPELHSETLALITERLVKIDVQVQVDLEDLADDVGDGVVQGIPQLQSTLIDEAEDWGYSDEESDTDESLDPDAQRAKDIRDNVEKMDMILEVLFSHYAACFSSTSINVRDAAWDDLLCQFATIILPTYRSRHTQFLLFHFAQTSPLMMDTFLATCIEIASDQKKPAIMRQTSAAYLASFVARGKHVPSPIVRDVFEIIRNQLDELRSNHEPACRGPDLRRYSTYYSLVQALLYIFCFRWSDLEVTSEEHIEDDDLLGVDEYEHVWIPGVKETLAQNCFSRLNPLKVCSPAIVTEFARISNHLGVIYVFHLHETNKRLRLTHTITASQRNDDNNSLPDRETALSARKDESYQQLDEYFPFDPYHLPRSKKWIEGDYREWKGVPGLDDDRAAESDSEEDEDEDSDIEEVDGMDDEGSSSP